MGMMFGGWAREEAEERRWKLYGWIFWLIWWPTQEAVKLIIGWAFTWGPRERRAFRLLYREGMPYVYKEVYDENGNISMHRWAPEIRLPEGYKWL